MTLSATPPSGSAGATATTANPPIAIGGVGGSGTRLIAALLRRCGYYIGTDLNPAEDNLWFTLLFKRTELWSAEPAEFARTAEVFQAAMCGGNPLNARRSHWLERLAATDRPQHDADWLAQRVASLRQACRQAPQPQRRWGWKEPNTHLFLDRLQSVFPNLKYIHVMRNGLDMAYSDNQNQLRNWGQIILGAADYAITPYWSLKFWCQVHRRIIMLGQRAPDRFLLLNYDAFCADPRPSIETLADFLDLSLDAPTVASMSAEVRPPASIGRFRSQRLDRFDPADVAYVEQLGFDTASSAVL